MRLSRASFEDRYSCAKILATAYAEGRLGYCEFTIRQNAVSYAKTTADLDKLISDLTEPERTANQPLPPSAPRRVNRRTVLIAGGVALVAAGGVFGLRWIFSGQPEAEVPSPGKETRASASPTTASPEDVISKGKELVASMYAWLKRNGYAKFAQAEIDFDTELMSVQVLAQSKTKKGLCDHITLRVGKSVQVEPNSDKVDAHVSVEVLQTTDLDHVISESKRRLPGVTLYMVGWVTLSPGGNRMVVIFLNDAKWPTVEWDETGTKVLKVDAEGIPAR